MTIAFVQKTTATGVVANPATTGITTPAFSSSTTLNNVLVAAGGWAPDNNSGHTVIYTDSSSNTWTTNKQTNQLTTNGGYVGIGSAKVTTAGTSTVTQKSSAASGSSIGNQLVAAEFSGLSTTVDQSAANTAGVSTTSITVATTATTNANDLVVGSVIMQASGVTTTALSNPPTLNGSTTGVNSLNFQTSTGTLACEAAYAIISATGTQSVVWTYNSSTSGATEAVVVVFEAPSSDVPSAQIIL